MRDYPDLAREGLDFGSVTVSAIPDEGFCLIHRRRTAWARDATHTGSLRTAADLSASQAIRLFQTTDYNLGVTPQTGSSHVFFNSGESRSL